MTFYKQQISPTVEVRQVRLIKISAMGSGTHCLEHRRRKKKKKKTRPAFHLTFSCELTQHITVQLIKWICFRSSALTPIFQGAEIRSTVTEECLQNKNWCITSRGAGRRWACLLPACCRPWPLLYSIQYGSPHMCVCSVLPNWEMVPLVTVCHRCFHLISITPVFVVLLQRGEAHWRNLSYDYFPTCTFCVVFLDGDFYSSNRVGTLLAPVP